MLKLASLLQDSFFFFVYPQYCIYCEEPLLPCKKFFCENCWSFLELTQRKERCLQCFSFCLQTFCLKCLKNPQNIRSAYLFESIEPAICFSKEIIKSRFLKERIASFFAYQLLSLFSEKIEGVFFIPSMACMKSVSKNLSYLLQVPCFYKKKESFFKGKNIVVLFLKREEKKEKKLAEELSLFSYKNLFFLSFLGI